MLKINEREGMAAIVVYPDTEDMESYIGSRLQEDSPYVILYVDGIWFNRRWQLDAKNINKLHEALHQLDKDAWKIKFIDEYETVVETTYSQYDLWKSLKNRDGLLSDLFSSDIRIVDKTDTLYQ